MNKEMLIAYVQAWLSFLFRERPSRKIKSIYLFGSVARGEFDERSDVDIFIDTEKNWVKAIEKACERSFKKFYRSDEYKKFRFHGIENEIKPKIGVLEEWKLKGSVEREGIVLFSPALPKRLDKYFLVTMETIRDVTKRNRVIRHLFGRVEKEFAKKGLIEQLEGKILSPRIFLIPSKNLNEVVVFLTKEGVKFSLFEIWC